MNIGRRRFAAVTMAGLGAMSPLLARSQAAWPAKPIRVISAGSPGGGSDVFFNFVVERLKQRLGQTLYIENRPGATGMIAASVASTATPDGYTFFISQTATNAIALSLYAKPSYDPKKDLPPVARIATAPSVIAVKADSGIRTLDQLIALLKAKPEKATYASGGIGNSAHLTGHIFTSRIGVKGMHIPYKGDAPSITGLLSGDVTFTAANLPLFVELAKAGQVRLLALTQAARVRSFPDLPTVQEIGQIGPFDYFSWYGLSAGTGTPQPVIDRMGAEIVAILNESEVAANIRGFSAEPAPLGPQAYKAFIDEEIRKWSAIVKDSGASAT